MLDDAGVVQSSYHSAHLNKGTDELQLLSVECDYPGTHLMVSQPNSRAVPTSTSSSDDSFVNPVEQELMGRSPSWIDILGVWKLT